MTNRQVKLNPPTLPGFAIISIGTAGMNTNTAQLARRLSGLRCRWILADRIRRRNDPHQFFEMPDHFRIGVGGDSDTFSKVLNGSAKPSTK